MALLEVRFVSKSFTEEKRVVTILKEISFEVDEHEFVCLIGPSGCGKSLLLRIIAGVEPPSAGEVLFEQELIKPENPRVASVFQSPSLMPWLTVEQNIELGLEALGLLEQERKKRVQEYMQLVGLLGCKDAYPRELSAGMKQRVSIARALATKPVLLCMDDPFGALDPLTTENLREEVLLLWKSPDFPTSSVLLATNNVEEAVYLADRVIVLSEAPATIKAFIKIDLPRPRNKKSRSFYLAVDKLYSLMT